MTFPPHLQNASKKASEALKDVKIQEIIKHKKSKSFKPLVSLPETASVQELLTVLKQNDILSVPIYRNVDGNSRIFTGLVSVSDVLTASIFKEVFDSTKEFFEADFFDYLDNLEQEQFFASPISRLIKTSENSPWIYYSTDPVDELVKLFTNAKQHRALVIDAEMFELSIPKPVSRNRPISASSSLVIISQTDIASFLYSSFQGQTLLNQSVVEPLLDISTADIGNFGGVDVLMAMDVRQSALHGFRTIHVDKLQAVPVINEKGVVVGNLSAADMRGLTLENSKTITKPVYEFLEGIPRKHQVLKADQLCTVDQESTLGFALERILKNRIHRLWIVQDEVLKGVVSLTDILGLFVS
jgi:CBS domain-containing protein